MNTQEIYQKLKDGVEKIFNSNDYKNYLKFCSMFKGYSFHNTILIFMQKPDAIMVAGIKSWNKMGRYVKKGEKGIPILAPKIIKEKEKVILNEKEEEIEKNVLRGFIPVYVYDISQTEGKDIPILDNKLKTSTIEGKTLFNIIKEISKYPIVFEELPAYKNGYYDFRKIVLSTKIKGDQITKTLLHEYIHSVIEKEEEFDNSRRQKAEILAESVTYIVANYFNLDTEDYSFSYIATWSKDINELIKYGKEIVYYSNQVIDSIENYQYQKGEKVS